MDQNEAIRVVSQALIKDSAVRAVFLKGSHARGEEDAFSDVDMYCLVNCDLMEGFLERRISYLENYRKLIYWSESDFVGPQIVGFFEDGLHFDLYTVTLESLRHTDEILILHDPEGLMLEYKAEMFSMTDVEASKLLSDFTFSLLEFEWRQAKDTPELVLGIDEFAIKKGHTYNTGIHDLRGETMLDLLAGRKLDVLGAYAE